MQRGETVLETYEAANMDRESPRYVETLVNSVSQYVWLNPAGGRAPNLPAPQAGSYELQPPAPQPLGVTSNDFVGDVRQRTGFDGLAAIDEITIVCAPDLMSAYKQGLIDDTVLVGLQKSMLTHCEQMGDRVAILDVPPGKDPQEILEWRDGSHDRLRVRHAVLPLDQDLDPLDKTGKRDPSVPPCGHMAGIWARTDTERGVHKAPGQRDRARRARPRSRTSPRASRTCSTRRASTASALPGTRGIRVWGARTLSSDPAWRYINVRRLFNLVEESIERGTQWVVFEPNDYRLWQRVQRDVTSFLRAPWRNGALFGATPEQAFYVKCDEETNPPEVDRRRPAGRRNRHVRR